MPKPSAPHNVTLPDDALKAIDRAAANRSRFLAEAAREKLRGPASSGLEPPPKRRGRRSTRAA